MIITYVNKPLKRDWGKSETLPDQNYTVKELFQRFAKGLPVQASRQQPIYLGEDNDIDLEKVNKLSIMEKADLSDELAAKAADIDQHLTDKKAERSEARAKAEAEKQAAEAARKAAEQPKS